MNVNVRDQHGVTKQSSLIAHLPLKVTNCPHPPPSPQILARTSAVLDQIFWVDLIWIENDKNVRIADVVHAAVVGVPGRSVIGFYELELPQVKPPDQHSS